MSEDLDDTDIDPADIDPLEARFQKYGHRIEQPPLRELAEDERIVRTMGLRFIVPNQFKVGDTLDATTAAFINAAWHTAAINRFGPIRQELLSDPRLDYELIDGALQDHLDEFKYTPRPLSDAGLEDTPTDAKLKALIAFGRPHFNKAMRGLFKDNRKAYEEALKQWVTDNRDMLQDLMSSEEATVNSLIASMTGEDAGEDE